MVLVALLLLTSCSYVQPLTPLKPLSVGEVRLTDIEMPEYVQEGLSYEVILRTDSEETPQIRRICFRWVSEEISSRDPSLYCYSMDGNLGAGTSCAVWTSGGPLGSAPFCAEASEIRTDIPGRLTVTIRPTNLKLNYNRLEAQVEYVSPAGLVRMSNAVKTPVTVQQ